MYPALQKELETFERRTPKSAEAHKKNLKRIPLGVASNYRAYDPYPIFVQEGSGEQVPRPRWQRIHRSQPMFWRADGRALPSGGDEGRRRSGLHTGTMLRHAARHGVGTGGRNLHALSGGDVPLRQQRHGSHHAQRFVWRAPRPGATRSSNSKADITACMMRRWSA